MKKRKRRRHHKKISHRIGGSNATLCAGLIGVAVCIGIVIFGVQMAGKKQSAKEEMPELAAETPKTLAGAGVNEISESGEIVGAGSELEGAGQFERENAATSKTIYQEEPEETVPETLLSEPVLEQRMAWAEESASDRAETGMEGLAETVATDERAESSAGADVPGATGGNAGNDNGILPGTILSADQLNFDELSQYFTAVPIEAGDAVYNRINGKSWQENDHISLSDLRYLKVLHYNFSGQIQVGEMIVNKSIAEDVLSIFEELFACGYQIQSMHLIDNYWTGDPDDSDTASIDANNTSAFCYRPITNGSKLSNHAYGLAIDINPQQNPYVSYSSGSPKWYHENANDYIARDTGLPHVITHEDAAFLIFQKYGFTWGGDWNNPKDYQHFEKK